MHRSFFRLVRLFSQNRAGATAIEYSLICAFIVLAMIVGARLLGTETSNKYNYVHEEVENGMK